MKKMRPTKFLLILASTIILALACTMGNSVHLLPAITLTEIPTIIPSPTRISTPFTFVQIITASTPFPVWAANFSNPILAALVGQKPDFQDDFSSICIDESHNWKVCSTPEWRPKQNPLVLVTARPALDLQPDLQKGYSLLNKGWFYTIPGSSKNPYYAHIDNGTLLLQLPEGKENKDSMVYNPHLIRENFVLSLDFQFDETQPDATIRFQFNQSADQSVALDLSKDKSWAFHWGLRGSEQSRTGRYEYFPPERINIAIIMRGDECAVYLNNVPLDYFSGCRTAAIVQKSPQAVSIHVLAEPGHPAAVLIDNVKLWDLDNLHSLP
jgi:hypothetical protein